MLARLSIAIALVARAALGQGVDAVGLPHISIVGAVHDSIADRPLIGALVQLVHAAERGSAWSATTDARGRYRIDSIAPGDYLISFFHPALDSAAVIAPIRRVRLGDRDPERIDLGLPGAPRVIAALCPNEPLSDSTAVIVGEVRDVDTKAPLANAVVLAEWIDFIIDGTAFRSERQRLTAHSSVEGRFALCALPGGGEVGVRVVAGANESGRLDVPLSPNGIVRRDFTVGAGSSRLARTVITSGAGGRADTVWRGPARLIGTVRSEANEPVPDAVVEVWKTGLSATTDASGRFELTNLPVGTHALEVRRIGFVPQHSIVHLATTVPTRTEVVLDKPVRLLDAIRVTARTVYSRRQVELAQRRRRGFGHFIGREELERAASMRVSDILQRVPGVRVLPTPTGEVVSFRDGGSIGGRCSPTVYLDGMRLGMDDDINFVSMASSLEAIEVYTSAAQAPPEYWGGSCGSILLWTRMAPPVPKRPKPKQ
jgi:hypothetical protein